jgi:hypothetical protein
MRSEVTTPLTISVGGLGVLAARRCRARRDLVVRGAVRDDHDGGAVTERREPHVSSAEASAQDRVKLPHGLTSDQANPALALLAEDTLRPRRRGRSAEQGPL